jgi:hypothetical protein
LLVFFPPSSCDRSLSATSSHFVAVCNRQPFRSFIIARSSTTSLRPPRSKTIPSTMLPEFVPSFVSSPLLLPFPPTLFFALLDSLQLGWSSRSLHRVLHQHHGQSRALLHHTDR